MKELTRFLTSGSFMNFNDSTSENEVLNILGKPSEIEDYGKGGKYFHYHNLRFSFSNNILDGINISFISESNSIQIVIDSEIIFVNKNTTLIEILSLLNKLSIKWSIPYESSHLDYIEVKTSYDLRIYYYYENEKLIRISKKIN